MEEKKVLQANSEENRKTELQDRKKTRRKLARRDVVFIIIAAVAIAAVIVAVLFVVRDVSTRKLEKEGRQYFGGTVNTIDAGGRLTKADDGTTMVERSGSKSGITDLPIYYDEDRRFTITEDMIYYTPRDVGYKRVDHFTDLYLDEHDNVHALVNGKDVPLQRGFLYNGKDMFIFLEAVKLTINGHDTELPPLSYVEAGKSPTVSIFDFEKKEFTSEETDGDITAAADENDYTAYLRSDSLETADGVKHLLFTRPDLLDHIK